MAGSFSALAADGRVIWQVHLTYRSRFKALGAPAVGDLDGDGADEIVVSALDGRVHCFSADGSLRWTTSVYPVEGGYHSPVIVDMGDGPRVLLLGETDGVVRALDAAGNEVWRYTTGGAIGIHMSMTPFREGGEPRVFIANNKTGQNVIDAQGHELVRLAIGGGGGQIFGPSAADLDGDGHVELLMPRIRYPRIHVLAADGSERATIPVPAQVWGAPMVADLDGDGVPEIVIVETTNGRVTALRAHGARPGGEVQWPTSRGAFDGRRSILRPSPGRGRPARRHVGSVEIARSAPMDEFQTGEQALCFIAPVESADAWVWSEVTQPDGVRHIFVNRLNDPDHGWIDALDAGTYATAARLTQTTDGRVLGHTSERVEFEPFAGERRTGATLAEELATMTGSAAPPSDHVAAIRFRRDMFDARMAEAAANGTTDERRALIAEVAREHDVLRAEIARRTFAAQAESDAAELASGSMRRRGCRTTRSQMLPRRCISGDSCRHGEAVTRGHVHFHREPGEHDGLGAGVVRRLDRGGNVARWRNAAGR